MTTVLAYLRSHISPQTRETLYVLATLGVAGVGVTAQENGSLDQAVASVVLTAISLFVAVLNSAPRMAAVYALLGAVGCVLQIVAVEHAGSSWAGYLGLAAVILAKVIAALRTPNALPAAVELIEADHTALPPIIRQQLKDVVDDAVKTVTETLIPPDLRVIQEPDGGLSGTRSTGQHRADQ